MRQKNRKPHSVPRCARCALASSALNNQLVAYHQTHVGTQYKIKLESFKGRIGFREWRKHLIESNSVIVSMSMDEEDPLGPPKNTQNLDLSKLSAQELKIYRMYGKLPTTQQILTSKFQDKKYFDSGDYAMQKQSGNKGSIPGGVPLRHPNAEKVKEMYNRNSISAANAGILYNGKLGLLNESTPNEEDEA